MTLKSTIELANGVAMPTFGLGVWQMKDGEEVSNAVKWAIEAGYISIDTAAEYGNEAGVGKGIKESGINREDLFVTTKVRSEMQGYESTLQAYEDSLERLGLDYVDLYLVHWPVEGKTKDTWRALEKLYKDKKVRAIGVCNFHVHHFEELLKDAEIVPMVNQIELHPLLSQESIREYCNQHNIVVEAYSPLGSGKILNHPVIQEIAEKYNKTVAQVLLRWDIQIGVVTIPKSTHKERIYENADIYDFELTQEDMDNINALNKNERVGGDPENLPI